MDASDTTNGNAGCKPLNSFHVGGDEFALLAPGQSDVQAVDYAVALALFFGFAPFGTSFVA